ncbi:uncharacterized protein LOC130792496 isoform X2 [Actinidia eriantha]|uniref:uncharacterized protein LOC130792496 isoform X2 n=1 Tax=Actinidia eriantha TaxID=165200 RepID=UPI00258258B9|nr:uncharacterized protein LOC130792496 isoform X2 [Actinidia eriantha]
MQGGRGGRDPFSDFGDPFTSFGGFGGFGDHRSLLSSLSGGRDPFDDPFFTRPFGSMFESSIFTSPFGRMFESSIFGPTGNPFTDMYAPRFIESQVPQSNNSRGPIIEELNSDDEKDEDKEEKKGNPRKHGQSSHKPYVEDPDDGVEGTKSKQMQYRNDFNEVNNTHSQPQTHSFNFQSSTVSYGGTNGAYYTSSRTRRTGSDGLTLEESKEADTATGQATHQISRGIHDKGHMVTRKFNSDGKVDTMQTLHNLNEDELSGFEEAWKGNARKHLPGWNEGLNMHDGFTRQYGPSSSRGGYALPSNERPHKTRSMRSDPVERAGPSPSQHSVWMRADFGDRTGFSRGRPRSGGAVNVHQHRRH